MVLAGVVVVGGVVVLGGAVPVWATMSSIDGGSIVPGLPGRELASPECSPVTTSRGSIAMPWAVAQAMLSLISLVMNDADEQSMLGWSKVWLTKPNALLLA